MTFLKNLGDKLGSAAGTAAEKAKKMADISKLNSTISSEEKQISQAYVDIGKQIFELEKDNPESPAAELCQKILAAQQAIEELKQRIEDLKSDEKPVVTPLDKQPSAVADRKFCGNCGAANSASSKFCNSCGAPMNQP